MRLASIILSLLTLYLAAGLTMFSMSTLFYWGETVKTVRQIQAEGHYSTAKAAGITMAAFVGAWPYLLIKAEKR